MDDEMMTQVLRQHSHEASPAFAIATSDSEGRGGCKALGLTWGRHQALQLPEGERVLSKWMALGIVAMVAVDDEGMPVQGRADGNLHLGTVFRGAGTLSLTTQRIIGVTVQVEGVLGSYGPQHSECVAFTLPLADIEWVNLQRKQGMLGPKDKGIDIVTLSRGVVFADFDRYVTEDNYARKQPKSEAMKAIIRATAEVQSPNATPEQQRLIQAALAGQWVADGDDLCATFAPDMSDEEAEAPEEPSPEPVLDDPSTEQAEAVSSEAEPAAFCRWCGTRIIEEANFCGECGRAVE